MIKDNTYFANKDKDSLLGCLNDKILKYYRHLDESGLYQTITRSFLAYYGGDLNNENAMFQSAILTKDGKAGQKTKVKANHYRNLVMHAVGLATANKPALTAIAANTDFKSQAQTILASSLLDYYFNVADVTDLTRQATELSCVTGEGWIHLPWNRDAGDLYDIQGKPIYTGDIDPSVHSIIDIIRDTTKKNNKHDWLIVKLEINKYELAKLYPDFAEEIINSGKSKFADEDSFRLNITVTEDENSDIIQYFTFYHKANKVVENGRLVVFTDSHIIFDNALPYQDIPLIPIFSSNLHHSCFGYSPFNDLVGLQQAHDNLMSTVLSNNLTFGTQHLWMPSGTDINVAQLEGGLRLIQSVQPPQPLQLTQSSPESYNLINMLAGMQETLSGISSTVRGSPESNLKSGAALALVVAQSVQFGSKLEASYAKMVEKVGETIIKHLQDFARTPRIATIVGAAKQPLLKEFTKDDISEIKRVQVQQVSAMSKTISGRLELAQQVMQLPPDQARMYMNIVNTGQLPDEMQITSPLLVIKQENEKMSNKEQVSVIITENHAEHIRIHNELINSPDAKLDPELISIALTHIQEHLDLWRAADPAILMLTGQQPPPPPAMPNVNNPAAGIAPVPPQGMESQQPNMPNMPALPQEAPAESQAAYEQFVGNVQ